MTTIRLTLLMPLLSLTACAVVWGQPYKVEFMSESSVNVTYDPALTNMGEVQNVAQTHCAQYGKDAYPGKDMSSPWGLTSLVFRCQARPVLRPDSGTK